MRRTLHPSARREGPTLICFGSATKHDEPRRRCLPGLGLVVAVALVISLAAPAAASIHSQIHSERHLEGSGAAGMMSGFGMSGFGGMMGAGDRFRPSHSAATAHSDSFGPSSIMGRYGTGGNSMHNGSGTSSTMAIILIALLSGAALIGVAIWKPWRAQRPAPLEILRKRLASGQITTQEYEARRRALTGGT